MNQFIDMQWLMTHHRTNHQPELNRRICSCHFIRSEIEQSNSQTDFDRICIFGLDNETDEGKKQIETIFNINIGMYLSFNAINAIEWVTTWTSSNPDKKQQNDCPVHIYCSRYSNLNRFPVPANEVVKRIANNWLAMRPKKKMRKKTAATTNGTELHSTALPAHRHELKRTERHFYGFMITENGNNGRNRNRHKKTKKSVSSSSSTTFRFSSICSLRRSVSSYAFHLAQMEFEASQNWFISWFCYVCTNRIDELPINCGSIETYKRRRNVCPCAVARPSSGHPCHPSQSDDVSHWQQISIWFNFIISGRRYVRTRTEKKKTVHFRADEGQNGFEMLVPCAVSKI